MARLHRVAMTVAYSAKRLILDLGDGRAFFALLAPSDRATLRGTGSSGGEA